MERYQRGHQQPVEGERPIGVLLVFACLTVAIAAVLWGLNAARQQRPGAAFDSGSDSAVASQKDEMRDADDSDVAVTAQTFLRTLDKLAFGSYNKKYDHVRTKLDWLTRDEAIVDQYIADPLCGAMATAGMFHDMMGGLQYIWKTENLNKMNKATPVYFMAGDGDPVGNYGEGVKKVYNRFLKVGCKDVKLKLYKDGRHEMLNELNKDEVYADILDWLNSKI